MGLQSFQSIFHYYSVNHVTCVCFNNFPMSSGFATADFEIAAFQSQTNIIFLDLLILFCVTCSPLELPAVKLTHKITL